MNNGNPVGHVLCVKIPHFICCELLLREKEYIINDGEVKVVVLKKIYKV